MNIIEFKTGIRDTKFGKDCKVADCVNIYEAIMGDNCFVGPWVEIQSNTKIGSNVRIHSHSLICEGMIIGDNCFIGHGVMTANSKYPRSGDDFWECLAPKIGDNVSVGSNATILPGIKIGDNVQIGAGCIVSKNIPSNSIVVSNSGLRFLDE